MAKGKRLGGGAVGDLSLVTKATAKRPKAKAAKEADGTEPRSFRISRAVLGRLDIAAALRDEKIGEFVEKAIVERIARLEKERGEAFPEKDAIR